jgi:hypothetical protein
MDLQQSTWALVAGIVADRAGADGHESAMDAATALLDR